MNFKDFLKTISPNPLTTLDTAISMKKYVAIDLSVHNKELASIDISSADTCEKYIANYLKTYNAKVAYGGYLEERNLYSGAQNFIGTENRNIHLGIDLWCEAGTKVVAVLDGEIHSYQNNDNLGDYGPTIILKHTIKGVEFYSLYGHLNQKSIENLTIGQKIKQGQVIARLGQSEINGGYAPHLHFQLIKDLQGNFGDYPGVCNKESLDFYKKNCPDSNLLLKMK